MKITKFVHSCLMVETENSTVLFDPGVYSWESGLVNLQQIENLDHIVITHEHADHCHPEFIKAVLERFPQASIICNTSVKTVLTNAGVNATFATNTDHIKPFDAPHEQLPILSVTPPDNTGYHVDGSFTHPGDSHSFTETKSVLALPVTAPWGSTTHAVELALKLKPLYVLPIHDWHYHEHARGQMYDMLNKALAESGITVLTPEDGTPISLEV